MNGKERLAVASAAILALCAAGAHAEKAYGPGVTDTEIKIGQTFAYSGPTSAYATIARAEAAYFQMVNDRGGINGRKIKFISVDDAYSPPKTVEQTRRLVEQEEVLALFTSLGTPTNLAVRKYLNQHKVPQLFVLSGAASMNDPQNFPWTMPFIPAYRTEAQAFAAYVTQHFPKARIAALYQNDDFGKDYLQGFKDALGEKAAQVVAEASYEVTDPTVDSQIITLKGSGADTLVTFATAKAGAQAIRKVASIGWKPTHFISYTTASIEAALKPAGLENAVGLISSQYAKDPSDPRWAADPALRDYLAWMKKYYPAGDALDVLNVGGYNYAQVAVQVLKQCGDDLTRENVLRQAANLRDLALPMLRPGITINTGPADYLPIEQLQMVRFDGRLWVAVGELIAARRR